MKSVIDKACHIPLSNITFAAMDVSPTLKETVYRFFVYGDITTQLLNLPRQRVFDHINHLLTY